MGAAAAPATTPADDVQSVAQGGLSASRAAGVLGLVSIPAHGALLVMHPHGLLTTVTLGAMTLWCAACASHVLRGSIGGAALRGLLVMSAAMVLVHALMVAGVPGVHYAGHIGHAGMEGACATQAMLGLVALELCVASSAALALRRGP